MKIFQGIVIWNPTHEQKKEGEKSKVIVPFENALLANDLQSATLILGRKIPESFLDQLEQVEVVCRPF